MYNLSIVHIEDEFEEFDNLVGTVAVWLEDYWDQASGKDTMSVTKQIAKCDEERTSWIVFEITNQQKKAHKVRYIFVKDIEIPKAVEEYIFDDSIFIVDVLRPVAGQTQLGITVLESLESVKQFTDDINKIALFTAHQGNGIEATDQQMPRKIKKESEFELAEFVGAALLASIGDG